MVEKGSCMTCFLPTAAKVWLDPHSAHGMQLLQTLPRLIDVKLTM